MHPIVNIAIKAAREAGEVIMKGVDRPDLIEIKQKAPNDFVTNIDIKAEDVIKYVISKAHPDHGIVAEESDQESDSEHQWIIDPIDGTQNFIRGIPHFAISIAYAYKGRVEHGVIYNPNNGECFSASKGKGARLNDTRIRVSTTATLAKSLVGLDLPYTRSDNHQRYYMDVTESILPHLGGMRHLGCASLSLAYTACGRFDAYFEPHLNNWDIAAGSLIVKEAGGLVTDFHGADDYLKSGNILAGNPAILKALLPKVRATAACL